MNQPDPLELVPESNKVSLFRDEAGDVVIIRHALSSSATSPYAEEDVMVVIPRAYVLSFAKRVTDLAAEPTMQGGE